MSSPYILQLLYILISKDVVSFSPMLLTSFVLPRAKCHTSHLQEVYLLYYTYCCTQKHMANRKRFLPVTFLRQETDLCWAADRNRPSWRHAACYQSSLVRSLPRNVSHPHPNNYHSFITFIQKLLLFNKFRAQCFSLVKFICFVKVGFRNWLTLGVQSTTSKL